MFKLNSMNRSCSRDQRSTPRRSRRRGATLIEFALVITALMMLTLGLVQYSIIASTSMGLSQLAREGARFAAVNGHYKDDQTVKDQIKLLAPDYGLNYDDLLIEFTPALPASRKQYLPFTVNLTYNMGKKMFLPSSFMGTNFVGSNKKVTASYMME